MSDLSERLRVFASEQESLARGAIDNPYDGTDMMFHNACMSLAKDLREAADALDAAEKERDEAVRFIGVANEEFVLRGYPSGDRTVVLANIRALPPQSQSAEER